MDTSVTVKYFISEMLRFRKIMCSTKYTVEEKEGYFGALFHVYLWVENYEEVEGPMVALTDEFSRRMSYEAMKEIQNA